MAISYIAMQMLFAVLQALIDETFLPYIDAIMISGCSYQHLQHLANIFNETGQYDLLDVLQQTIRGKFGNSLGYLRLWEMPGS